jgi:hypothetical protein
MVQLTSLSEKIFEVLPPNVEGELPRVSTTRHEATLEQRRKGSTNIGYINLSATCAGRTAIATLVVVKTAARHPSAETTAIASGGTDESWLSLTILWK